MKTLALACLLLLTGPCARAGSAISRGALRCLEGPTSEPSCSGTGLRVWLRGEQVRRLDWTAETSRQFIHRQYRWQADRPRSAVETIYAKLDDRAELLVAPRRLSRRRYRLDVPRPGLHNRELREHAEFLRSDFQAHRQDFTPATGQPHA